MPWEQRYGIRGSRWADYSINTLNIGYFYHKDMKFEGVPLERCGRNSVAFTYNPTGRDYNPHFTVPGFYNMGKLREASLPLL